MFPVGVQTRLKRRCCLFRAENTPEVALKCDTLLKAAMFGLWFGLEAYTEAEIFGLRYNL